MTIPYFQDDTVTLHHGAAVEVIRDLPDGSVGCIVTSPPYFGLRAYGHDEREQGTEQTVGEFVSGLIEVFREARRVLADDGTMWVNLGDTYSSKANARNTDAGREAKGHSRQLGMLQPQRNTTSVAPYKSLLMVPERLALALIDDGWILRNRITWHKSNGTPEPVRDRFTAKSEAVWFFTKSAQYWFDLDAVKVPGGNKVAGNKDRASYGAGMGTEKAHRKHAATNPKSTLSNKAFATANPGDCWTLTDDDPATGMPDVWSLANKPFPEAHFAVMNPELARRAVKSGAKPGCTVLDPYSGSGTTGMVAAELGHPYIGIDLYREYLDLSLRTRLAQSTILDGEGA